MGNPSDNKALIVLGMHRSGTSAMTGLLGEMGCSLPKDLMAAKDQNAKGFFESNVITSLNEDLLNSAGLKWSDLNRFPESWYATSTAAEFHQRATAAVRQEFEDSRLIALKDPRHCRLVPFWEDVLTGLDIQPSYVCIHRHPAEVAASMLRWGRIEPAYGQMLWLRHVLDAEFATRGKSRMFVAYDQVMSDWRAVIGRIAATFDPGFPRSVDEATEGVQGFLSADLKRFSLQQLTLPRLDDTSDWLATALEVMETWSRTGENPSDHARLDHVRVGMDAASETLVALSTELMSRHRETAQAQAALARSEAAASEATTTLHATLHTTLLKTSTLQKDLKRRTEELYLSRRRPVRSFLSYLEFRTLKILHSNGYPVSSRAMAQHPYLDPKYGPDGAKARASSGVFSKSGLVPFRSNVPTAVIVTHEASRTGAPILALNLARSLSEQMNIVSVILRDGELVPDFQQASTAVYLVEAGRDNLKPFTDLLDDITARLPPAFALVNSIVSRHILEALRDYRIPSVVLLHEFASYTLPSTAFRDTFELADEIVFSSDLTLRDAIDRTGYVRQASRFHVLPQGRCAVPGGKESDEQREEERQRLTARLRPNGDAAREFLVIGAGTVQYRKGVDLFIDVARRVLADDVGRNARFAWIGNGFDTERDAVYSVFLQDQIRRAGLTDRMIMLPATAEIDHVYKLSDALLLTSRLDPLPNVAIDALSEGVPVICFDKTTGIADVLTKAGLHDACVAGYLDPAEAAEKVLQLMRSPEVYLHVSDHAKAFAARTFDFDRYAAKLRELGLAASKSDANR